MKSWGYCNFGDVLDRQSTSEVWNAFLTSPSIEDKGCRKAKTSSMIITHWHKRRKKRIRLPTDRKGTFVENNG
ncbi:hypothetical protein WG66_009510 [Moniliophthora roreri]|nr:hypothetical protein WG66_009510 [Moniliophthora roreri]